MDSWINYAAFLLVAKHVKRFPQPVQRYIFPEFGKQAESRLQAVLLA